MHMATAKYAPGTTEISGKIAGTIYRRDKTFAIVQRTPRHVTNQNVTRKQRNNAFRKASDYCGNIQRAGKVPLWRQYANNHPRTNHLGQQITLTWRQWAIKFNTMRFFNQLEPIIDPPDD